MGVVKITSQACVQLSRIAKESNTKAILFYVKGGGCNGYNYKLEPTNEAPDRLDEVIKRPDYDLHVCGSSMMHLLGTTIDWKNDVMGQCFDFTNPMAQSSCGCGTSFASKANK